MGIPVDAPDVNRSDSIFDVIDGRIVFGLMGIKGMGQAAAEKIVQERNQNGPYKSFQDFISRTDFRTVNRKAIDVLIRTGGFDNLDKTRSTLLLNYDKAIAYEEKIRSGTSNGQASLFGDTDIQEFMEYKYEEVEEMPRMEMLSMEKELIGCYVSGHPLDAWKPIIDKCVTLSSENMDRAARLAKAEKEALDADPRISWQQKRNAGKIYTALGMIQDLQVKVNKKGEQMAFAKLSDFKGSINITFFSNVWGTVRDRIQEEGVYAFKGRVDGFRDTPAFLVNSMEDPQNLQEQSITSLHIQMNSGFKSAKEINVIKDFLFGEQGGCSVYFHIEAGGKSYTVKGTSMLTAPHTQSFEQKLKDMPFVQEVWYE